MTEETAQLLPGEEEEPPSLAAQTAPAHDQPPVYQQQPGIAQVAPSTLALNQPPVYQQQPGIAQVAPSTLAHNQPPIYQQQQPPVDQQQPGFAQVAPSTLALNQQPVYQQQPGIAQVAPSTLAHNQPPVHQQQQPPVYQQWQPPVYQQQPGAAATMQPMIQGQLPGQMMCPAYTAQSQQMWPSTQMAYVTPPPVAIPDTGLTGVDLRPPSYFHMSLIVTFICFMLNIISLSLGGTAIMQSIKCEEHKKNGQYILAKHDGKIALGFNIANILFTAATSIIVIALALKVN